MFGRDSASIGIKVAASTPQNGNTSPSSQPPTIEHAGHLLMEATIEPSTQKVQGTVYPTLGTLTGRWRGATELMALEAVQYDSEGEAGGCRPAPTGQPGCTAHPSHWVRRGRAGWEGALTADKRSASHRGLLRMIRVLHRGKSWWDESVRQGTRNYASATACRNARARSLQCLLPTAIREAAANRAPSPLRRLWLAAVRAVVSMNR
eukprot:EG_transcript_30361